MPIGPFPDFNACVAHMMKPKEEGGGGYDEETAKKVCGKLKAELEESFSWASDLEVLKPYRHLIHGKAIHPVKTYHPCEWPQLRVYLEEELKKSAETLIGKPLFLDHVRPLNGSVLGAHYEDGALEYIARAEDEDALRMIRNGQIKHASVQFEWKTLENVNGVAPRGITFQHLSLLKDMEPGDLASSVEIWESIAKELKEAQIVTTTILRDGRSKDLTPPNPQKGSETEDKIKMEPPEEPPAELEETKKTIEALKAQIQVLESQRATLQEELKRVKKPGEAIISSNVTPPREMIPKKAIEAVLPPDWVARAWGLGPQRLVQDIKRVLRQGREAYIRG